MNKIKLSDHFVLSEFESEDTKEVKIDENLLQKLEEFRKIINEDNQTETPIIINSGYRTPEHNKKIGGSPKSQHMNGTAADIAKIKGYTIDKMAKIAKKVGFDGVGKYDTFLHVDVRGYKATWDWRKK